jgi:Protein of unknown function (DUF4232)
MQMPVVAHELAELCAPEAIDGTFSFGISAAKQQTVSLHFLNKGKSACRLIGQPGPSFAVDSHSMNVGNCWLCGPDARPLPRTGVPPGDEVLLGPGERAIVDLHWAMAGDSCQWADWVDFFLRWEKQTGYLFIPSDWPMHICSVVESDGYRKEEAPLVGETASPSLRISVSPVPVYSDERARLHVELDGPGDGSQTGVGCADLYAVSETAEGATRLDPLPTVHARKIDSYTPGQIAEDKNRQWESWKKDFKRNCNVEAGQSAAEADIGAETLARVTHLEWRTVAKPGNEPVFLSVPTHFAALDVDTLDPHWGEAVNGIRAGLSVDRDTFTDGEAVPLHVRWENVSAVSPLAQAECQSRGLTWRSGIPNSTCSRLCRLNPCAWDMGGAPSKSKKERRSTISGRSLPHLLPGLLVHFTFSRCCRVRASITS